MQEWRQRRPPPRPLPPSARLYTIIKVPPSCTQRRAQGGAPKTGLLDDPQALAEAVLVHVLEPRAGDGGVEVHTVGQGSDLDVRLGRRRERVLRALALRAEAPEGAMVGADVLSELALELLQRFSWPGTNRVAHLTNRVVASRLSFIKCALKWLTYAIEWKVKGGKD